MLAVYVPYHSKNAFSISNGITPNSGEIYFYSEMELSQLPTHHYSEILYCSHKCARIGPSPCHLTLNNGAAPLFGNDLVNSFPKMVRPNADHIHIQAESNLCPYVEVGRCEMY